MRFLKDILKLIILVSFFTGCQDNYYPDGLDSSEEILVIDGMLTDCDSLVTVTVYNAEAFGVDSYEAIGDATVWLLDNSGNEYLFNIQPQEGYYMLEMTDIVLNDSSKYFIRVETSDGYIFESTPQIFPEKVEITSVSAEIGEEEEQSKNDNGDVISATYEGLDVSISVESSDTSKFYVHYADSAVYQSNYASYYIAIGALSTIPVVASSIDLDGVQKINNYNIGFLKYTNDSDVPAVYDDWILMLKEYSLNEECYNYYEKIINQVSAQDKIFDPVPTQITGNMECVTDSSVTALGFFEVSRLTKKYVAYHWNPDMDEYEYKELEAYSAPATGSYRDEPDGWISFDD